MRIKGDSERQSKTQRKTNRDRGAVREEDIDRQRVREAKSETQRQSETETDKDGRKDVCEAEGEDRGRV